MPTEPALTLIEERTVAGTPETPARCDKCGYYLKIFNACRWCGNDERPRYGCVHRMPESGICVICRFVLDSPTQIQKERDKVIGILREFASVRLYNNRDILLPLQIQASELLERIEDHAD